MISVRINGEDSAITSQGTPRLSDLIELIKASIDPEHIITEILLDGRFVEDHEWQSGTGQLGTAILEIETGLVGDYLDSRLGQAASVVGACYNEFRSARKSFQAGDMVGGNKLLADAVTALKAFFEWYATLMQLAPEDVRARFEINPIVEGIIAACKNISQQQLYQSWWALGESLQKDLEPKLDELEDFLRQAHRNC